MVGNRVLIVVYQFPPRGGVGVLRALSFAKYLPRHNCGVWVVTARNAATACCDPTLLRQVPPEVTVRRTFTPEIPYAWRDRLWGRLNRPAANAAAVLPVGADARLRQGLRRLLQRLSTPDPQRVWVPFALREARRLVRHEGIDTVLLSVPPFSTLGVGVALKKAFPHLKMISDFRDEWLDYTISDIESHGDSAKRQRAAVLEREAVKASDFVLSVTPSWVESIRRRYPEQPASKFLYLPNGYEPEDFVCFHPRPHGGSRMVITYMGTVYANPVYSPAAFLDALDGMPPEILDGLEVRFIGRVAQEAEPLLAGRKSRIVRFGFLPQAGGFRLLEETDLLLLLIGSATAQSVKLFEYLATGKPILAVAPRGSEVEQVLGETRGGRCADPADRAGIQAMIREAWGCFRAGRAWLDGPDRAAVEAYARPALVAALVQMTGLGRSIER